MANKQEVRAINTAAIFADIGSSVSDIDFHLNKYKDIYNTCEDLYEKVVLGRSIVDLACSKLGFMTLIINDDEFLAIDLASLIPVSLEIISFIEELEEVALSVEDPNKKIEAINLTLLARVKLYETKVFFYRFVDLSSLGGGLGSFKI